MKNDDSREIEKIISETIMMQSSPKEKQIKKESFSPSLIQVLIPTIIFLIILVIVLYLILINN